MTEFESAARMRGFLAWIAKKDESHADAWLRHEKVLTQRYAWMVVSPEDFARTVMVEAASTFKSDYPDKYGAAGKYIFGVARNLVHEHRRPPAGPVDPPEPPPVLPDELPLTLLMGGRIKKCLDGLGPDKGLLLEYNAADRGSRNKVAAKFNVAPGALRTRISRLLSRLRRCIEEP